MIVDTKLYATQAFNGNTSPHSSKVKLQHALSVDPPLLTPPLLKCANCVRVDGMLPGAIAEIEDGNTLLGEVPQANRYIMQIRK